MNETTLPSNDLKRLRQALHEVLNAARAESRAVDKAIEDCSHESMQEVHASHLHELNAIQALVGSLELFERRLVGRVEP